MNIDSGPDGRDGFKSDAGEGYLPAWQVRPSRTEGWGYPRIASALEVGLNPARLFGQDGNGLVIVA